MAKKARRKTATAKISPQSNSTAKRVTTNTEKKTVTIIGKAIPEPCEVKKEKGNEDVVKKKKDNDNEEPYRVLNCPHCGDMMLLYFKTDTNCGIFRHGFDCKTYVNINPHASQKDCEEYVKSGKILGCGKPFCINKQTGNVEKCDYI